MRLTSTLAWFRLRPGLPLAVVLSLSATLGSAQPSKSPLSGIYTCTDDKGRRLTSDRPIPECSTKEQQVLNRDGSLKAVHPPTLTAEERAEKEARERKAAEARAVQTDLVRRDRNLMLRYPNEATHRLAREAALDNVRLAIRATEARMKELAAERKPLLDEAEFYKDKRLPGKLRIALEANDAAVEAQRSAAVNQEAELGRVNLLYDLELARLKKLWGGAAPGSLGPLPSASAASASRPASVAR